MKKVSAPILLFVVLLTVFSALNTSAASPTPTPVQRPRVVFGPASATPSSKPPVIIAQTPTPAPTRTPTPSTDEIIIGKPSATPTPATSFTPRPTPFPIASPSGAWNPLGKPLSFTEIRAHLNNAKRTLQAKPMQTATVTPTGETIYRIDTKFVTLAIYEPRLKQMHYVTIPKEYFLLRDNEMILPSSVPNRNLRIRIVRANGVNTAALAYDEYSNPLVPLLVQYPVERNGFFYEMAYYISVHPALVSPEIARAGQVYVRNILETANQNLRRKGIYTSPEAFEVAEKLVVVEHIDHSRFNNENRLALFEEVYSLFALNEGNTYRYAVSSAGAGGVVQMIPSTYRIVRNLYPQANLMPDFVEGMRNHINASEAMLIYIQMTWNDLQNNSTIQNALADGIATPAELMSAGYNSNPAKLPGYIRRGGANWKNLIPRETQMYHRIYASFDSLITLPPRTATR